MTASYWQRGEALDYVNSTDEVIEPGTIIELEERIGVAGTLILPEKTGSLHVAGCFEIAKSDADEEIAMGASVYFDGEGITAEEGDDSTPAGWAAQASAAGDENIYVKIG